MNTADMKAALGAFKRGKTVLAWDKKDASECWHICHAVRGDGDLFARKIVLDSLGGHFTYADWLETNSPGEYEHLTGDQVQAGRHAFVDACIAELERRISAATGAK